VGTTGFSTVLALTAGVMGALQVAILGALGQRIGELEASAFAFVLTALAGIVILLVARQSLSGLVEATRQPWWMVIGGLTGVVVVISLVIAGPRIGIVATSALLIAGQLGGASLVDRFGLFGAERVPIDATRIAGLALLAVGAMLTLRR
jgi:bacterial/archaeal transporter family-2 protein